MDEIEVETVESLETAPDAPDYVLYGGKGGVGKTTTAAATALASAEDGAPTLAVSTDPAHSLADAFETPVPSDPTQIRENLYAVEIDPDEALAAGGLFGLDADPDGEGNAEVELGGLGDLLGGDAPMPGADEAAAMQQLLRYLDDDRFDRVVVDTAPTGHTLRLLELPELLESTLGRLAQVRQRVGDVAANLPFGDGGGGADLDAARERIERLRGVLRDPARTDFRIVLVPEGMSVAEAGRLRDRLDAFGVPVGTVVVNRVMEEFADVAGADASFVSPDLEDCEFCQRRWEVQQDALGDAQELFRGHDVKRVPLFADEPRGVDALRAVGACLR
jgi:arsenite-transporting ATPase